MAVVLAVARYRRVHSEPNYQGRRLSEWLDDSMEGHIGSRTEQEVRQLVHNGTTAVEQIGTNAIPTLIAWLQAEDPTTTRYIGPLALCGRRSADELHLLANHGFAILGDTALSAAPDIVRATRHKDESVRRWALICLLRMKPENQILLPALTNLLADNSSRIKGEAAFAIIAYFPDAPEAARAYAILPEEQRPLGRATNATQLP